MAPAPAPHGRGRTSEPMHKAAPTTQAPAPTRCTQVNRAPSANFDKSNTQGIAKQSSNMTDVIEVC